jgi:hypothetical protein
MLFAEEGYEGYRSAGQTREGIRCPPSVGGVGSGDHSDLIRAIAGMKRIQTVPIVASSLNIAYGARFAACSEIVISA